MYAIAAAYILHILFLLFCELFEYWTLASRLWCAQRFYVLRRPIRAAAAAWPRALPNMSTDVLGVWCGEVYRAVAAHSRLSWRNVIVILICLCFFCILTCCRSFQLLRCLRRGCVNFVRWLLWDYTFLNRVIKIRSNICMHIEYYTYT